MTQNSSTPIHNARCSPDIFGIISDGPRKLHDLNKLNAIGLPGGFTRTKFSLYTSSASEGGNFPKHPFKDFDLVVLRSQNGKTRVFTQINPENPWNAHSSQLASRNQRVDLLLSCAQLQVESLERVYRSTLAPLVGKQTTNERRAARSDRGFLDQLDSGQLSLSQMDDANLDNHHRNLGIILSAADFLHNCANNCGDLLDSLTRMEGGINLKQIAALKLCVQDVTCKIISIKNKSEKALSSSNQEASARVDLRSARRDNFSNILAGVGVAIAVVPSIDFAPWTWINALDPGKLSLVAFSAFAWAALIRLLPRPNLLKHTHDR